MRKGVIKVDIIYEVKIRLRRIKIEKRESSQVTYRNVLKFMKINDKMFTFERG